MKEANLEIGFVFSIAKNILRKINEISVPIVNDFINDDGIFFR